MAGRGTDIKLGGNPEHRARRRAGTSASAQQYEEIYRDEYEKWKKDYEEVKSLGGLYVIGTERHESRRIDNQLRGRSGRQGDPGKSKFFISMDDELMRLFGGDKMKNIMSRIGMDGGEAIYHPMLSRSIENAQKKVEERNFEIRKHLLEYDDVLNQQRKYIYEQRDAILLDQDLKKRVNESSAVMVGDMIDDYSAARKRDELSAFNAFTEQLRIKFGYHLTLEKNAPEYKNAEMLEKRIIDDLEKDMITKEELIGNVYLNLIIRDNYLHAVDRRWLDHLESMEALREAVYLRHYAQKNPLTEYKVAGYRILENMIEEIRQEIASRLHLIRIQLADGSQERRSVSRSISANQSASHSSINSFGAGSSGASGSQPMAGASRPEGATVVRTQPKVGRNDPCPCGSGKKYKQCHGR
jgi:preprotein translocase subunit SecA